MIPYPFALGCLLGVAVCCAFFVWRQRNYTRALHAQLDHVNAALRQLEVLWVMPDTQPVDDAIRGQADAYATYLLLQQTAYTRWREEAAQERARAEKLL